jgi:hypothetical protein
MLPDRFERAQRVEWQPAAVDRTFGRNGAAPLRSNIGQHVMNSPTF